MTTEPPLTEIIQYLHAALHNAGANVSLDHSEWHAWLYEVQDNPAAPACVQRLRYDWDGPTPRSQELAETLNSLAWSAGYRDAETPSKGTVSLPDHYHLFGELLVAHAVATLNIQEQTEPLEERTHPEDQ